MLTIRKLKNWKGICKMFNSKTLNLIQNYGKVILEQGEEEMDPEMMEGGDEQMDVTDVQDPSQEMTQQEVPLTSEAEEQYIRDLVDAALYQPSSEDSKTLSDLQGVINTKNYTNAREEILPIVLNIIRPSTEGSGLRDELDQIS